MPEVTVILWRDIPAQVTSGSGRRATRALLSERFQEAIDAAAMAAGLFGTDGYLAEWRREAVARDGAVEAAVEIAKQLRLRDIGGIIVIDFIDMEIRGNRAKVVEAFRDALARDKTRSQVFDITELGLVEMTRKRIGEGLLTEYSEICPDCEGRGVLVDYSLLE